MNWNLLSWDIPCSMASWSLKIMEFETWVVVMACWGWGVGAGMTNLVYIVVKTIQFG